jgi:hypothetical protein
MSLFCMTCEAVRPKHMCVSIGLLISALRCLCEICTAILLPSVTGHFTLTHKAGYSKWQWMEEYWHPIYSNSKWSFFSSFSVYLVIDSINRISACPYTYLSCKFGIFACPYTYLSSKFGSVKAVVIRSHITLHIPASVSVVVTGLSP